MSKGLSGSNLMEIHGEPGLQSAGGVAQDEGAWSMVRGVVPDEGACLALLPGQQSLSSLPGCSCRALQAMVNLLLFLLEAGPMPLLCSYWRVLRRLDDGLSY